MQTNYRPPTEDEIRNIVLGAKVIAVVGMKDETQKDSSAFSIPAVMHSRGIEIVPVNPTITTALGVSSLKRVSDLTRSVDVLQVFRRSEAVMAIANEAVALALAPAIRPKVA
jgi:uncharacterized protein